MGHYGYRLFVVHVREGSKRKNIDFSKAGAGHLSDSLFTDLCKHVDATLKLEDPPRVSDEGMPQPPTGNVVRYTAVHRNDFELRLDFYHGTFGDGGTLIDPEGKNVDLDIEGRAVSKPYRALLALPEKGAAGILAVEARGRACPYRRVEASLKSIYSTPYRLFLSEGIADRAAVAHFIRNGIVRELEVTTLGTARDGDLLAERVKMTVKIAGSEKIQETMRSRALEWADQKWRTLANRDARSSLANELATAAVGVAIPLNFVDSLLRVDGPGDRTRSLRPSTEIGEWIYDLGDVRLSDEKWFNTVSMSVSELFPSMAAARGVVPPE
ncbi:hypothetical protein [Micromonospora sp. DT47]|uniref:hypothetical protein n=1 Tax=Micromonospora sp. DT47 TaxID=3393431 RepID=UPI003CFBA13F